MNSFRDLLAVVILIVLTGNASALATIAAPNFVVVLTDDQSWVGSSVVMDPKHPDSVSDSYLTPNMKRMAAAGMQFTNAYAPAPYCCPTRRSLQVGQSPARHLYQQDREQWFKAYRQRLTIPRLLKQANPDYQTAHFGKWDFRFDLVPPQQLGYDVSDGPTSNREGGGRNSAKRRSPIAEDPKQVFGITQRACDFMRQACEAKQPFYVQLSHYAVHLDVYSTEDSLARVRQRGVGAKHNDAAFAAMTEDLDESLGQLLDEITKLGLQENTYIFFMSDNGGRGDLPGVEAGQNRNHPLRSGKGHMYEGGIRVPLFVSGPNIAPLSIRDTPVSGVDLLPTLAALAGYSDPLPADLDGGSLVPLLLGKDEVAVERPNPFLIFHHAYNRQSQTALRMEEWKLVRTKGELELFDLANDLGESSDLSQSMPEKTAELEKLMNEYLTAVNAEIRGGTKARPLGKKKPAVEREFDQLKSEASGR